jgi:hypothetical protein
MFFANPYGFIALLGIPAVLAIHFFQRRAKSLPVSTLFLLHQTQRESASGRRFDRLLNSPPLWLQLLMVLLLTWFLVEPRYQKQQSVQRIAVVLDSSASMQVFKDKVVAKLEKELDGLQGRANKAEYFLLDSNPANPRLYHGDSRDAFFVALRAWQPREGTHGSRHSLRMARSMAGEKGAVVYLTDTPVDQLEYGSHLFAVGHEEANCGLTGIQFSDRDGELVWQATAKNYAAVAQTRQWLLELPGGTRSASREVTIPARGVVTLQGSFPEGVERCRIHLSPDAFTIDDKLPIQRPEPKLLTVMAMANTEMEPVANKLIESFQYVTLATDSADIDVAVMNQLSLGTTDSHGIVFVRPAGKSENYLKGTIVAEKHRLMDGLNWQPLLVKEVLRIPHLESDSVLLWQGERPLIFLRGGGRDQLVFNFDLKQSNAEKQEAFAVLLWRFLEMVRQRKVAHSAAVVETTQQLQVASDPTAGELVIEQQTIDGGVLSETKTTPTAGLVAPDEPGYFHVRQGENPLFTGSSYFADTREADFVDCAEKDSWAPTASAAVQQHTREDHLWRYVLAFTVLAMLASWYFGNGSFSSQRKD